MKAQAFGSPIFVKCAAYVVQEITNLEDAIDFLDEWPEDRRDLIHETALKACCDAYDGNKPLSAARAAFYGFAKRAAILEDPTSAMQWIAACKTGGGKRSV
ncbi:DUF982 domain-containing protein [Mesorhizobium sp. ORS 3428]|uniref:DUF982 domain-containing protein n=1 Tax=Mesorhizobium plurifarium TaxID=69974 RepID=A0A090EU66_MESPL|nr:DUF982 domain-containing protein [Mesorhizobium sp. ORS 3428]OHV76804.1 hypothetical protein ORS3428_28755 [Mesorhizobium sp. ORS 3428]CDX35045.1 conserved hypothetical protein [Mesorhizobium plurifarium]CDX38451.1 conserved hypothetical protein [Mesorhizobium sp. SOD10]